MSQIKSAQKVEQLRSVVVKDYADELSVAREDSGGSTFIVTAPDPREGMLDTLRSFVTANACPDPTDLDADPIYVKREAVTKWIDEQVERLTEKWGERSGEFTRQTIHLSVSREHTTILANLLSDRPLNDEVRGTVREALTTASDW